MTDDRERKLSRAREIRQQLAGPGPGRHQLRHARLVRTIGLGTVAVAFSIYWLALEYGVDIDELLGFLGFSAIFVGMIVGLALLAGFLLWAVKRFRRRE